MLSPGDFEDQTNFEEEGNNVAMYSEDVIPYGHGPPLETDDVFELPMARCDCKQYIGPIATQFISRMTTRQREIMERNQGRRMTVEEFGEAAGEEMDALDPFRDTLTACCKDAIRLEVGTITEEDLPVSRVVRFEEGGYEGCEKCQKNLEKALTIKRRDPKMPWEDVEKLLPRRRTLKACCRTNIMEPITMNWNLERADRIVQSDVRSTVPLEGQRLIEGRTLQDEYRGNITVRRVREEDLRKLNPYTFGRHSLEGLFDTDPDSTRDDSLLIIMPPPSEDRPVKSVSIAKHILTGAETTSAPRAIPWPSLYQIDESLFPVMPDTGKYFAYRPLEYALGLNVMEQNYRVTGMMRTGLDGYEVATATGGYFVR